jgi:hypothetical protein
MASGKCCSGATHSAGRRHSLTNPEHQWRTSPLRRAGFAWAWVPGALMWQTPLRGGTDASHEETGTEEEVKRVLCPQLRGRRDRSLYVCSRKQETIQEERVPLGWSPTPQWGP